MEIVSQQLPVNHDIVLFTCTHFGTIFQHIEGVQEMVDYIASTPNTWCAGGGDWIESLMVDDPRFDIRTVDNRADVPARQYLLAAETFKPIAKKMLVALEGNHDWYTTRKAGNLLYHIFCKSLNIRYGSYSSKIILKDKKGSTMYKIYFTHGRKSIGSTADDPIRREANMKLQLKRHLQAKAGDAIVMAKGHCLSEDTEILTAKGWKKYNEIDKSDVALTFNCREEKSEWQPIKDIFIYKNQYDQMIQCKTRMVDFCVTPEHRLICLNQKTKTKDYISDVPQPNRINNLPKSIYRRENGHYRIQIVRNNAKVFQKTFRTLNEAKEKYKEVIERYKPLQWEDNTAEDSSKLSQFTIPVSAYSKLPDFPIDDNWIRLLGWLISEGHFRKNGAVQLFQSWSKRLVIANLLKTLCIEHSIYRGAMKGKKLIDPHTGKTYYTKDDCATFYITVKNSKSILQFIQSKRIPEYAFLFSDRQFGIFLEALVAGDGTWQRYMQSGYYFSKDKNSIDILQALCVSHGWKSYSKKRIDGSYCLGFSKRTKSTIFKYSTNVVPATDITWCVSVDNGTIFIRRNGRVCVVGNSHKLIVCKPSKELYLVDNSKRVVQQYTYNIPSGEYIDPNLRWYASCGSFLKLYREPIEIVNEKNKKEMFPVSGYAEQAEYDPVELGYVKVKVRDRQIADVEKVIL